MHAIVNPYAFEVLSMGGLSVSMAAGILGVYVAKAAPCVCTGLWMLSVYANPLLALAQTQIAVLASLPYPLPLVFQHIDLFSSF